MSDNIPDSPAPQPGAYPPPAPGAYPPPAQGTPPAPPAYGAPPAYAAPPAYGAPQAPYGAAPQQYGAAPQYGAPAYGYGAPAKTNALAIVSLVASLVGLTFVPFLGSIVGVITGHMSLSQLKTNGEQGRGLALAGTIIGWVGLGLAILGVIAFFAIIGFAASMSSTYSS